LYANVFKILPVKFYNFINGMRYCQSRYGRHRIDLSQGSLRNVHWAKSCHWNEQHIPGAIHIPLGQLKERLSELKQYKDSPLITQCRSGGRSAKALDVLKSAGFSKVYNMDGGIIALG
jgi:3-mercaptopyruvate sulfurtransferase SseA